MMLWALSYKLQYMLFHALATGGHPHNSGTKRTRRHVRVTPLTLGAWNVCTLMDHDGADRSE